jgi:hypothetical protein
MTKKLRQQAESWSPEDQEEVAELARGTGKRPNARKHGAYAKAAILPGERRQEFEALHSALVEEWAPVGRTEEDAVLSLAKGMWRKRRVQRYLEAEVVKAELDPRHPAYNDLAGLLTFIAFMQAKPDVAIEEHSHFLPSHQINYLLEKFPQNDFESTSEWAQAVLGEISTNLLPDAAKSYRDERAMPDELLALKSTATLSQDLFKQELALEERIDAMIDRAIKRLIQTKALKQMLGGPEIQSSNNKPAGSARIVDLKDHPGR